MRKVLFLMFLLLLMGLGAASVEAQVRIGGNTAPSAAAVLDLNATDAANAGTRGLVLPRVDLTSNTMPLTTGVANVTGTLVYDVTATLGQIGIYYWSGGAWVQASLPPTSPSDSGHVLISNGSQFVQNWYMLQPTTLTSPITLLSPPVSVTWQKIIDQMITINDTPWEYTIVPAPGVAQTDICTCNLPQITAHAYSAGFVYIYAINLRGAGGAIRVICYRPSA